MALSWYRSLDGVVQSRSPETHERCGDDQPFVDTVVVGSQTPGVATTPPPAMGTGTAPTAQTSLGSLLCSVDHFRDVSSPANVAQQLNAILAALAATPGS